MATNPTETEPHEEQDRPSSDGSRAALLVAFPEPKVLPVPRPRDPVGRKWLEGFGVIDPKVSTEHVSFTCRQGGTLYVTDVGSSNGTFVNGQRVTPQETVQLEDGAILRIGRTILVYREEWTGGRSPLPDLHRNLVSPFGMVDAAKHLEGLRRRPKRAVLIEAPTGTGKEALAAAVATANGRGKPFVPINMGAIPAATFESQLFGHRRGSFTGATDTTRGLIPAAEGGTVFFDEIGELQLDLQVKLLRVIENRQVQPVGADGPVAVDVFVVAATNRVLQKLVDAEQFRPDLLARLEILRIEIPTLADRPEDLWAIARDLRRREGEDYDASSVQPAAVERLMMHTWPRNVRELAARLERIATAVPPPALTLAAVAAELEDAPRRPTCSEADIDAALERCGNNKSKAADELKISRPQLLRRLAKRMKKS